MIDRRVVANANGCGVRTGCGVARWALALHIERSASARDAVGHGDGTHRRRPPQRAGAVRTTGAIRGVVYTSRKPRRDSGARGP